MLPLRSVTPGYFELLGLRIVEGRDFRSSDNRDAPGAAVVNQAFVDRYLPGVQVLGKKVWGNGRQQPAVTIVGVVSNVRNDDLTKPPEPEIYLPLWQAQAFSKTLVVRTAADPRSMSGAIQRELRAVNPTVAIENIKTMEQIRDESLASRSCSRRKSRRDPQVDPGGRIPLDCGRRAHGRAGRAASSARLAFVPVRSRPHRSCNVRRG